MKELFGNTYGLKSAQIKQLERLYRRKCRTDQIVSPELAVHLTEVSKQINRQVGVYVNRRGIIEKVFIGEHSSIFLPDTGRARAALTRLRGVRLIHTHLKNESITQDDLMDLALIRLDMVVAVTITNDSKPDNVYYSHLIADDKQEKLWDISKPLSYIT